MNVLINADGGMLLELLVFMAIEGMNGDITDEFLGTRLGVKK